MKRLIAPALVVASLGAQAALPDDGGQTVRLYGECAWYRSRTGGTYEGRQKDAPALDKAAIALAREFWGQGPGAPFERLTGREFFIGMQFGIETKAGEAEAERRFMQRIGGPARSTAEAEQTAKQMYRERNCDLLPR